MSAKDDWVRAAPPPDPTTPSPPAMLRALAPFESLLADIRPPTEGLLDCHTHLGLDEDGRSLDLPTLLAHLDEAGVARACVFPLHDPDRHPAYRVPNDRVLGWAAESGGRLSPFCRLDPSEEPAREGERCLNRGAQGIKLHPRAQAFGFDVAGIDDIFALAGEAKVPLLIHMGRGMPPVAEGLVQLAERHPETRMILAHAGIADQAVLAERLKDHPAVYYDTAVWSAIDLMELFARVPAERIVFGSDPPYGRTITGLFLALRVARHVGADAETLGRIGGGSVAGLLAQDDPIAPRPPLADRVRALNGALQRLNGYATMAFGAVFAQQPQMAAEMVDLALSVCRDPDPDGLGDTFELLGSTLSVTKELMRDPATAFFGVGLMHLSLSVANTGGV
jgi:uncharacterized protein